MQIIDRDIANNYDRVFVWRHYRDAMTKCLALITAIYAQRIFIEFSRINFRKIVSCVTSFMLTISQDFFSSKSLLTF